MASFAGALAQEAPPARAATLIGLLESDAGTEQERDEALAELRLLTTGERDDPETREAAFHLARYLQYREGLPSPGTRQAMTLATTQYPDDPRTAELLEVLAPAQYEAGEFAAAHVSYRRMLSTDHEEAPQPVLVKAALAAAEVDDHAAAFRWSQAIDLERLRPEQQIPVLLARVESAQGVHRLEIAVEAAVEVERRSQESLNVHADALLAAAVAADTLNDLDTAIERYETYINVHRDATRRPAAMLALARAWTLKNESGRAERTLRWLVEQHPDSREAPRARVELVELGSEEVTPERLERYIAAAREAGDGIGAQQICDHMLERYIAGGYPVEVITALATLAREDEGDSLAPLAARTTLRRGIEAVLELLISRGDTLGVAATAAEARSLDIPIPERQRDAVDAALRSFGLSTGVRSLVELALDDARAAVAGNDWSQAVALIDDALLLEPAPPAAVLVEATLIAAEGLWRGGDGGLAIDRIDDTLSRAADLAPAKLRPLHVLAADIRFSEGDRASACAGYRQAGGIYTTPWVERQLQRCAAPDTVAANEATR